MKNVLAAVEIEMCVETVDTIYIWMHINVVAEDEKYSRGEGQGAHGWQGERVRVNKNTF